MQRRERHPSRRAPTGQPGCAGCLLCRGVLPERKPKTRAATVRLRAGAAARLFVV